MAGRFRFDAFELDAGNRQLRRAGAPVELNSRYFDALALLVREQGRLVSKERFLEEVWAGVPVTDEALTQCIKTLRKQLGDDAASPRFIETVPKHGYRFVAQVENAAAQPTAAAASRRRELILLGAAGLVGGGAAGLIGGLLYGLLGAADVGAISALLVLVCVCVLIGAVAGAGVGFGIGAAGARPTLWSVIGGAAGGLIVGAVVKLIGLDAFTILLGQSPGDIAGAAEGALLGGAVGLALWLGARVDASLRRVIAIGAAMGALGGSATALLGGRLMAGSLSLLAERFPNSHLELDQIATLFGGLVTITAFEGALFGACVAGALAFARRRSRA